MEPISKTAEDMIWLPEREVLQACYSRMKAIMGKWMFPFIGSHYVTATSREWITKWELQVQLDRAIEEFE